MRRVCEWGGSVLLLLCLAVLLLLICVHSDRAGPVMGSSCCRAPSS